MVVTFYPHLPNNYKDWEDCSSPTHSSIRVIDKHGKTSRRGNKHYYHYDKESYDYINKLLEASEGKSFDDVYSKICKRFRRKKNLKFREEFKDSIDSMYNPRSHNNFYLTEDKVITRYKLGQRSSNLVKIPISASATYYVVNVKELFKYPKTLNRIKLLFGTKLCNKILDGYRMSESLGARVQDAIYHSLTYDYSMQYPRWYGGKNIIREVRDVNYRILYRYSRNHIKYMAELRDSQRKKRREFLKQQEIERSELLRKVEYNRKLQAILNEQEGRK